MTVLSAVLSAVLIAVMTRTMTLESSEAKLVALFRQALLALDEEVALEASGEADGMRDDQGLYPRWLHVLLPAEHHLQGDLQAGAGLQECHHHGVHLGAPQHGQEGSHAGHVYTASFVRSSRRRGSLRIHVRLMSSPSTSRNSRLRGKHVSSSSHAGELF